MARADWSALRDFLGARGAATVQLSWEELDGIVGGVPASATNHYPQWWHGDRPNTRAWRAAGYEVDSVRPGRSVLFRRVQLPTGTSTGHSVADAPPAAPSRTPSTPAPDTRRTADPGPRW